MNVLYLVGLLVGLAGMVALDLRFRLFFWRAPLRAAIVLVVGVAFFLAWDAVGVHLGIFFRGNLALLTGIQLAPEIPLEELLFLALLCYLTMNVYGVLSREGAVTTYLLLDLAFLGGVAVIALATFRSHRDPAWRRVGLAAVPLVVLTALFDNVLVGTGIVAYDPERISGIRIGVAPVEDFAYAIAAVVLLPCLWSLLTPRRPPLEKEART